MLAFWSLAAAVIAADSLPVFIGAVADLPDAVIGFGGLAVAYGLYKIGTLIGARRARARGATEFKESVKAELREEAKAELDEERSRRAHQKAVNREPPVDIGETVTVGIKEFKSHYSGKQTAVCKKEGFVIFVEDCPESVDVGDRISARIVSFGRGQTSAEAVYAE